MKKIILSVVLLISALNASAWTQWPPELMDTCSVQAPYGYPQSSKQVVGICRHAYVTAYDPAAKIPNWTAYTILPQNALGCWPRTNAFTADASIANGPRPDDYAGTGYDKGHVAPDGDMSFDERAELESFLMTNMFPQAGGLNRGIWKLLETSVRGWSFQLNQSFTVYAGAIYGPGDKTIGTGVVVPNAFYKIVINNQTGAMAGWLFPHRSDLGSDLTKVRAPVSQIQQLAQTRFPFPANARELQPGQEWPVDYGALTNAKRAKCK